MDEEKTQQEQQLEPSVDEILQQLDNGNLTLDDINGLYQNGKLSEETYTEVLNIVNEADSNDKLNTIIDGIMSGQMSVEDLDVMVQNGELSEEEYNTILSNIENGIDQEQMQEPQTEPQPLTGNYKEVNLLDKFIILKKYIQMYLDIFKDVEIDQLKTYQVNRLAKIFKNINQLQKDLAFYIDNNYELENYNKNIYSYQLFNRGFAENIKSFRRLMNLNPNEMIEDNNKNKKKDK